MESIQLKTPINSTQTHIDPTGSGTTSPTNGEPKPISGIPGQISVEEAVKGADGAKLNTLSLDSIGDKAKSGNSVAAGSMVDAKLVVELVDSLIPSLMVVLFARFKVQIEKSGMKLTAKEKDTLAPLVQNCLDALMINFNSPWVALAVTAGIMYGSKVIEHGGKAAIEKKNEEKKSAVRKEEKKEQTSDGKPAMKSVVEAVGELRPYDKDDIMKVLRKRKRGYDDAKEWLEKNWVKNGGVI